MPKRWLLCLLFLLMLFGLGSDWTETPSEMADQESVEKERWSMLASQVAKWVRKGDVLEARTQLAVLSNRFSKANLEKDPIGVEALHALSGVLLDMERALNQVKPDEAVLLRQAERLEITFDALTHPHQPMWKQYDHMLKQHLSIAQEAARMKNKAAAQEAIRQFYDDYQLIRPALIVSKRPSTVNRVDSLVTWVRTAEEWPKLKQGLTQLQRLIYPLFHGTDQEVALMVDGWNEELVIWTIFWVSILIVSVLGYVSWRKYQGFKNAAT